ncbi:MAG: peptidoglycan editing factor PgeF [Prevotellaceae bacterium]|nr:peptidoglycan editing factor PgeF [Prevotellaceae bacterium]
MLKLEHSRLLQKRCGVSHFFSTIEGGVGGGTYATFNLGAYCGDDPQTVAANRRILCDELGLRPDHLVVPHEVHGDGICRIDSSYFEMNEEGRATFLNSCDALVTTMPDVCLAVTTADCVPVLLCDIEKTVVMAVHAGWRGVVNGIVPKAMGMMVSEYGVPLSSVCAVTGPCVSAAAYEVSRELVDTFSSLFSREQMMLVARATDTSFFLDLRRAVELQFIDAGIDRKNIGIHPGCTYSQADRYFSARRQGLNSGRLLSGIKLG